jgi:hypothetical protein
MIEFETEDRGREDDLGGKMDSKVKEAICLGMQEG